MTTATTDTSRRMTSTSTPGAPKPKRVVWDTCPDPWKSEFFKVRSELEGKIAQLTREAEENTMSLINQQNAKRQLADGNALTLLGGANNIEALAKQLALSPKFADLNAAEHQYVAGLALATGLNPEFHIHAWISTKSVKGADGKWSKVRVLNVTPDYKALLLKAKSDRRVMIKDRKLTADEMKARGIPQQDIDEGAIGWVVEYYDLQDAAFCKQAGLEYEPLRGFGWWAAMKAEKSDYDEKTRKYGKETRVPNDVPNGRDGAFVAWKRAIRALYYQIADMSLVYAPQVGVKPEIVDEDVWQFNTAPDPAVIDGTFEETTDAGAYGPTVAEQPTPVIQDEQPAEQPAPADAPVVEPAPAADEPVTEAEVVEIVKAFCEKHALVIATARPILAELAGVRSLYDYKGSRAALQALADGYQPEGKLL